MTENPDRGLTADAPHPIEVIDDLVLDVDHPDYDGEADADNPNERLTEPPHLLEEE